MKKKKSNLKKIIYSKLIKIDYNTSLRDKNNQIEILMFRKNYFIIVSNRDLKFDRISFIITFVDFK
jgi:hypothetical protein